MLLAPVDAGPLGLAPPLTIGRELREAGRAWVTADMAFGDGAACPLGVSQESMVEIKVRGRSRVEGRGSVGRRVQGSNATTSSQSKGVSGVGNEVCLLSNRGARL